MQPLVSKLPSLWESRQKTLTAVGNKVLEKSSAQKRCFSNGSQKAVTKKKKVLLASIIFPLHSMLGTYYVLKFSFSEKATKFTPSLWFWHLLKNLSNVFTNLFLRFRPQKENRFNIGPRQIFFSQFATQVGSTESIDFDPLGHEHSCCEGL